MTIGLGEVADLVDDEQMRAGVMAQTAAQSRIAVECAEIAEQLAGAGEQHGVPAGESLVSDVLGDHRLADAVRPDEHDVGGIVEELERHQRVDGGAVATLAARPNRSRRAA